jgi:hypothetical protein
MTDKRWIHVSFSWPIGVGASTDSFEAVFSKAKYWMRYSRNCWMIYSGADLEVWRDRIRKINGMEKQSVFLLEFHADEAAGYLPEWMWEKLHDYEESDG